MGANSPVIVPSIYLSQSLLYLSTGLSVLRTRHELVPILGPHFRHLLIPYLCAPDRRHDKPLPAFLRAFFPPRPFVDLISESGCPASLTRCLTACPARYFLHHLYSIR